MELLRITRQIHCKAVEQRATLIHKQYNPDWGTSYSRPPIDPYLTSPPVTKSWRRHCWQCYTPTWEECSRALVTLYANCEVLSSGGLNTNRRLMVPSSGNRTEVALTAFLQHTPPAQCETRRQRNNTENDSNIIHNLRIERSSWFFTMALIHYHSADPDFWIRMTDYWSGRSHQMLKYVPLSVSDS